MLMVNLYGLELIAIIGEDDVYVHNKNILQNYLYSTANGTSDFNSDGDFIAQHLLLILEE